MKKFTILFFIYMVWATTNLFGQTTCTSEKGYNDFPFTQSGLTVAASGTGGYINYPYSTYTSCGVTTKTNSVWIGRSASTFTNTFSSPVNDMIYNVTAAGVGESVTITVNSGTASITYIGGNCSSLMNISGNVFTMASGTNNHGGRIKVHSTSNFTSITFSHNGVQNGLLMTMCFDAVFESVKPTVTTTSVTNVTNNSATSGGNVTSDGGATVSARGVCWNTTGTPTTANSLTSNGTGTGTFSSSLTGLTSNTLYYVRAYAINANGTSYGNQVTFTTSSSCTNPTVPKLNASASANCGTKSTTLSIATGTLNSATNWQWYSGSCGGTSVGSGTSIAVSPTTTTTYYARGEGGCVTPGNCASITITVNPIPTCSISGNETLCPSSTSNTYSGPASMNGYVWSITGNGSIPGNLTNENVSVNAGTNCNQAFDLTLVVANSFGCESTCNKTVSVIDNNAPTISCPSDVTINCQDNSLPSSTGSATGNDVCSGVTISSTDVSTQNADASTNGHYNYMITRTWKAMDDCGNQVTCDQIIKVQDITKPTAKCKNYTLNLSSGNGTITASDINDGSIDNCDNNLSLSLSKTSFNCSDAGANNVTLTATDASGNSSSCTAEVTVQYQPSCTIDITPSNNTFTGGNPNNIYLGFGPQSVTLTANATGGAGFTYSWSPNTYLSSSSSQNPVFTPTAEGNYTYTVTVTNSNGCNTTCKVTFCVKDVKVTGTKGNAAKVYLCHVPPGNNQNPQTLSISTNAVNAHLTEHTGDALGKCGSTCASNKRNAIAELILDIEDLEIISAPNPFNQNFKVSYISSSNTEATLIIYDITGKVLEKTTASGYSNHVELGYNLPDGVYTVSFTQGKIHKTFKMIKVN